MSQVVRTPWRESDLSRLPRSLLRRWVGLLRFRSARVGIVVLAAILFVVIFGPLVAPHSPTAEVAQPLSGPTWASLLGTDYVGRDVLSRLLCGGRTTVGLAVAGTLVAYLIGLPAGLVAGYVHTWVDTAIMRVVDLLLAFPPLLFLLVVATGAHDNVPVLVAAVGIVLAPGLTRIVRSAVLDVSHHGYVEAAVARGETSRGILLREILPNIMNVILADVALRFGGAVLAMVAVNFLGLGIQPPTSDWALMIANNREYLSLQPWAIIGPAVAIGALVVATNLIADGIARSVGSSVDGALGATST